MEEEEKEGYKYTAKEREILSHVGGEAYKHIAMIIQNKTESEALTVLIKSLNEKHKDLVQEWDATKGNYKEEEYKAKYKEFLDKTRYIRTIIKGYKEYRKLQSEKAKIRKIEAQLQELEKVEDYLEDDSIVSEEEFFKPD